MADKIKIKFLTAIWGARYIEEFARVSLPSYLAPGNLPYMTAAADVEVLIMTSTESRNLFDDLPIFAKLGELCSVRYITIDDLITPGNYGVTLTIAYARGIMDSGAEQTNTTFVFMNSDFVLADGSLKTLVGTLEEGHRCVMAPSLRARSEPTLPVLAAAVDTESETLVMPPREMVRLAFDNLHPTVIAKTVTQHFITCATHNQIYWQVDQNTLIARYHLIFMLAIRPEVPMSAVNSYCDYGFVPELVPSGAFTVLGDSDAFFMLELQAAAQEKQFLRCGQATPDVIADELSLWTTAEQRRFAQRDVVFRTGELPPGIETARRKLADYVNNVQAKLAEPLSHVDHYYWVFGVQAWRTLRKTGRRRQASLPKELLDRSASYLPGSAKTPFGRRSKMARLRNWCFQTFLGLAAIAQRQTGTRPNVAIWHHAWLDCRLVLNWIADVRMRRHQRTLLISEFESPLAGPLDEVGQLEARIGTETFLDEYDAMAPEEKAAVHGRFDNVLLHIYRSDVSSLQTLVAVAEQHIKATGTVAIYIEHAEGELDASNFSVELAQYIEDILPPHWIGYEVKARFAGGLAKRKLRRIEKRLFRHIIPSSLWKVPMSLAAVVGWAGVAVATAANNLRLHGNSESCPDFCSSAMVLLNRGETSTQTSAPAPEPRIELVA